MRPFRSADGESDADRGDGVEPAAISVEDCSLSFGDLSVLEDVSVRVDPGEFVGFVGPNGAGKTTLLRAISGALEPDSGTVSIDGVDIHAVSSKRSSQLVSVVPQDTTLSFSFPVRDVVEMGRHPHRSRFSSPTREDHEAVERALERTRTTDLAERPIDAISGGQRQRVVLARAITQETPAMLLDEPTASLDINHQLETLELVRELVDEGRTVCAAIHDLDLAARYCDRLVMLADGGVYRSGPPAEVLTGESLADVFDATATVTPNPITGTETVTALPGHRIKRDETDEATQLQNADIHVLGTGPTAACVLAQLESAQAETGLSLGPITSGDTAAETARTLGIDCLEVPPFESLSEPTLVAFENHVADADVTVVTESVLEANGAGTERLVESTQATADALVFVERESTGERDDSTPAHRHTVADGDLAHALEATTETVLETIETALERQLVSDKSATDSIDSDGESGTGLAAESSSD